MEEESALSKFLKKVQKATQGRIAALKQARASREKVDTSEEEIVNKTKEYFAPILKNAAKKSVDLAVRSAQNVTSIEAVEAAMEQLRKEHLDLWKSFSALLAKFSSKIHPDSKFLENLLHDYDLRRSYVDELVKVKGTSSSVSVSSTKIIIKDFADRFGVFWERINNYIKETYTDQGRELDKTSPFYLLKNSREFVEFYKIYKEYKVIKDNSEGVTTGIRSIRNDFEDILEIAASLENEFIKELGYYVMFYDEEEGDFHGFTRELFKEFSVRMKQNVLEEMNRSITDADLLNKAIGEFNVIWRKIVPKEMFLLMEKPPIEIVFYLMEKKMERR